MHLKSIELSGFKSFARRSQLEFKSPVTAIVGPNGSGKSNVTEAFRFVLGEQSMKSLRSKKGEDLIWNGSPELARGNKASVKIVLDNRKRVMNLDFEEVEIERVVFRDGVNEYLLNGSQVRLRDILELLAPTNIGPSGHHIISQGEADKILNANPRERREMIEDALGLRLYQYKKQESQNKLEKTEENLKQVELLRKELSPHIKFLRRQFEKLQKTKEMRVELLAKYIDFFSKERSFINQKKQQTESQLIEPNQKILIIRKELESATSSLKSYSQDAKSRELLKLESELRQIRSKKDDLSRQLGIIEGRQMALKQVLENQAREMGEATIPRLEVENLKSEISGHLQNADQNHDPVFLRSLLRMVFDKISKILSVGSKETDDGLNQTEMMSELEDQKGRLEVDRRKVSEEETRTSGLFDALRSEIEKEKDVNRDLEKNIFRLKAEESELLSLTNHLEDVLKNVVNLEKEFESELREAAVLVGKQVLEYHNFNSPDLDGYEINTRSVLRREIEKIKIRLEDAGGIGEEVEKEYREISERDAFLEKEISDLRQSSGSLKQLISDLESQLDQNFKNGIESINKHFQELFDSMFSGGSAKLAVVKAEKRKRKSDLELISELAESSEEETGPVLLDEEPVEEGLDIKINLPRKKIKGLEMLSGGERALTSIALIFALSQVNPPPFLVLDETDAALDEANSKRYGDMIGMLSKHSQLILITHNRETMSRAGILYGVTMGKEGFSKILSVAFEEALSVAK